MRLTPHFYLSELTVSQTAKRKNIDNNPPPEALENLRLLAQSLELVRALLGNKPIIISSGYRSKKLNKAIGGSKTSKHCDGLAADFICPGFGSTTEICQAIINSSIDFDQLILECPPNGWVHFGLRYGTMRKQVLTFKNRKYYNGIRP